jgi:uncharacterized protein
MKPELERAGGAAPVAQRERVVSIDMIRGIALLGVLLVNLLAAFRIPLAADILRWREPLGWGGAEVLTVLRRLVEFKALTLFSFLFGVGVAIQAGRVGNQPRSGFLARRFGALVAIGILHMLFIWNGDILTLYGICGLALIPLLEFPEYALIVLGLALIVWPTIGPYPVDFPATATLKSLADGAVRAYGSGTWPELFSFRLRETKLLIVPLLSLSLPRTLGLMLWGVAAWRKGWMADNARLWRWATILGVSADIGGEWLRIDEIPTIGLAMAYAAVLLLCHPRARWVAAAGQMALTNYLLQSVIFGLVFYSFGLGLFGRVGVVAALLGGLAVYGLQLAFSHWWLTRFYFGPCEWLWRSVSYLRWQPFVREGGLTVSRRAAAVLLVAVFGVAIPTFHLGLPMALARVGPRWGWSSGRPSAANLLGILAVLMGVWLLIWIATTMLREIRQLPCRIRLGLRPARLLQTGPYAWSRHPMYAAECCLWIGAIVLCGSPVGAAVLLCLAAPAGCWVVRREERALEKQFGEEYRSYRTRVPAWPRFR